MTKLSLRLTAFISICLVFVGCGDAPDFVATSQTYGLGHSDGSAGESDAVASSIRKIDARVVLPSGMTFNSFPDSTVLSQLDEADVGGGGETLVSLREDGRVLATFFNSDGEPILAGIVSDESTEISVETTVQTSIYVGLGTVLLPEEIKQRFWAGVRDFPGYNQVVVDAEELFLNDPLFFQSAVYRDLISAYLDGLLASETLEIGPRLVTDGAVKSGLQIEEVGGDAVVVVNTLRRRTHAFVYKLDFTNNSDARTTLIEESDLSNGGQVGFTKDVIVSATSAVTSTIGTLQNVAGGKGIEFARKESDMIDLSLNPAEKEANYSIRVVGPSLRERNLTDAEKSKLNELTLETVGIDFVMPLLLLVVGQDDYPEKYLPTFKANSGFLITIEGMIKDVAAAEVALEKGDFQTAVVEIFREAVDRNIGSKFQNLLEEFLDGISYAGDAVGSGFTVDQGSRIIDDTENLFKALKVVDQLLQAADWGRLTAAYATSNRVEDFRVQVTKNKVSLLPQSAAVIQGKAKSIKAVIQDGSTTLGAGEAFQYHWSTTGTYGIIRDDLGKSGTSFVSSRDTIEYLASEGSIPDDAMDEVNVEIVITGPGGTVPVGTAKPSKLVVRPRGFEIYPQDAEMMGGTTLPLRVVLTDGSDPFDSDIYDYQVIWDTPGEFGLFNGVTRNLTEDSTNRAPYEALEEAEEGVESVSAAIYSRLKGETASFSFEDRITGTIKITNDENKKIFYVSNTIISGHRTESSYILWFVRTVFDITPIEGATTYEATIVEHNPGQSHVGNTMTFQADDPNDLTDGVYRISTAYSSGSIPEEHPQAGSILAMRMGDALAFQGTIRGLIKVVVTLAP